MKRTMTRATVAFLVAAMAACGITGCGKGESIEDSKTEAGSKAESNVSDEKIVLNWYTWEANVQDELRTMAEEYSKFR